MRRLKARLRRIGWWLRGHAAAIAWGVMAVGVSVLFYDEKQDDAKDRRDGEVALEAAQAAQAAIERVEQEGLERDYALCSNSNEARAGVLAFIQGIVLNDGDGVVTPGEQEVLDFAAETFGPKDCPPDPSPGEDP